VGASVRVEADAFVDERFVALARLAGLVDADHARGKMLRLWRQCTDQNVAILPLEIINSVLGPNGADSLVKSFLGEHVDGGIRIRGTSGRIEWLENLRKNGKKGGKAKAKRQLSNAPANQEKEKEKEKEPKVDLPSLPPEALEVADQLRAEIIGSQPTHKLSRSWTETQRNKWASELAAMNRRDGRDWPAVRAVVRWLFHGQSSDYPFVVQSPSALAEKWDRIETARSRTPRSYNQPGDGLQAVLAIARGES
jgi:hypothetical protein